MSQSPPASVHVLSTTLLVCSLAACTLAQPVLAQPVALAPRATQSSSNTKAKDEESSWSDEAEAKLKKLQRDFDISWKVGVAIGALLIAVIIGLVVMHSRSKKKKEERRRDMEERPYDDYGGGAR